VASRALAIGLIAAFLGCYMEWPPDNSAFLFNAVAEILQSGTVLQSLTHPLVLSGLVGMLLLAYSAAHPMPNRRLLRAGILILCPMVFIVLLAGTLAVNLKMIGSTLPFLIIAIALWRQ
jgi:hypothetical protein